MANVLLKNIRKSYDGRNDVLADISLDIRDGEFVVLVGPSGCGKSTLLRMLSGLETITAGELQIGDRIANNLPPAQRGIAMVFQSYALYPHMTVHRNIAFGLRIAGLPRAAVEQRVRQAAQTLKIEHLLERYPRELSGGQRQRVAIGRAIVRQPQLFLFDEPLSNLDAALRNETRLEIARLHKQLGATIVYVTHDQVEAMTLGDKIVVMHGGRIQQAGTPLELYHAPANQFVASFIGSPKMNLMPAVLRAVDREHVTAGLQNGLLLNFDLPDVRAYPGQAVTLGIRPEHMSLQPVAGPFVSGTVNLVEHLGEADHVHLTLANGADVVMRSSPEYTPEIGEQVRVHIRRDAVHVFNEDGLSLGRRHIPARRIAQQAIAA